MIPDDAVVVDHATAPLPHAFRGMGTSTIAELENKMQLQASSVLLHNISLKPIKESFA